MSSDEWASNHEVQAIKGRSGKSGRDAGTASVLIWGDLSLCQDTWQPRLRSRAEAAGVSRGHTCGRLPSQREGPNGECAWGGKFVERAKKAAFPGGDTAGGAKAVKPLGSCQTAELFPAWTANKGSRAKVR